MKTRWITWLITISAFLDTVYGVIAENSGLLSEIGVSPKVTKIILALGILWTAFSKSLVSKNEIQNIGGGGIKNPPR